MATTQTKEQSKANQSTNTPVLSADLEYMCDEHAAYFLEMLENWRNRLIAEAGETVHHMQTEAERFADVVDVASLDDEHARELRRRERERRLITKIDKSIANLIEGDYGFCNTCGSDIGLNRLEARPTATECIECKTVAEIREVQEGKGRRVEEQQA